MSVPVSLAATLLLLGVAGNCIAQASVDAAGAELVAERAESLPAEPVGADSMLGRIAPALAGERRAPIAARVTAERTRLVDVESMPVGTDGRALAELGGVSYRWWLTRGRSDVGLGVGAIGRVITAPPGVVDGGTSLAGSVPTVSVGWRYRVNNDSIVFADASGARGLGINGSGNFVNTKLGAEWQSPVSRFGLDKRGHLGVRFDSGYRMSLRLRKSGVGIYVRGQF